MFFRKGRKNKLSNMFFRKGRKNNFSKKEKIIKKIFIFLVESGIKIIYKKINNGR